MKHRLERVNEVIKRELGDLIRREFTFTAQLVTVQHVDITPDLKHAHVYVSAIGSDSERREAIAQMHDARTRLQQELSKRVVLKYTPQLHFKLDESVERGTRVLTILEELQIPEEEHDDKDPQTEEGESRP